MGNIALTVQRAESYRHVLTEKGRGPIAFVTVVPTDPVSGLNAALGIAVANERGYTPVPMGWASFETWDAADANADEVNRALGLGAMEVLRIVASTMGGMRYIRRAV